MRYIQTQLNHFYNQPTPQVTQVEKWAQFEGRAQDASNDLVAAFTFHGLMHDFAEAYLVDLPTPVKRLPGIYEAYKAHEAKMDALIYETLGLPYSSEKFLENWEFGKMIVGWADMYALLVEAYHFMPSRGLNWGIPLERPDLSALYNFRWPISNEQAYEELLDRYEELVLSQHMKLLYKYSI
jgi:5'-deoxynucleotidase YfbR-like HD superfamily hydrolase